jgi:hypothetical protein
METNFLPEYVVLAMCHNFKGEPGDLTRARVADFDDRFFQKFGRGIAEETQKAGIVLDKRIASIVMFIAVTSKFQDPKRSVPIAVEVYLNARRHEVLDESRAPFAGIVAGVAAPVAAVAKRPAAAAGRKRPGAATTRVASRRRRSRAPAGASRKK